MYISSKLKQTILENNITRKENVDFENRTEYTIPKIIPNFKEICFLSVQKHIDTESYEVIKALLSKRRLKHKQITFPDYY